MSDMSLAEKIIRAETTEALKKLRKDMIEVFKNLPNAEEIVDRDYYIIKDELTKRGAL
jgi:hypothetical protein